MNRLTGQPVWAVVPAAGVGSRMQADRPKQYLPLLGRAVLSHTLQTLLAHRQISGVVLALGADDPYWPELPEADDRRVITVTGGRERADSVLAALAEVVRRDPDSLALVHDAARPCLQLQDIDKLLQAVSRSDQGAILGMPVRDTLKRVGGGLQIETTVDRSQLWHALTPQLFAAAELRQAIGGALAAGVAVTDEASAMEWAGFHPEVVSGRADNIKITHPDDLALAELFIQAAGHSAV